MKNILALTVGAVLYALLSPVFILAFFGVKWAQDFLDEGEEPLDIYV